MSASISVDGCEFIRARHKVSQRELAKRSGVTNSTISLIQIQPDEPLGRRAQAHRSMVFRCGLAEFFALEPERKAKGLLPLRTS